MDEKLLKHEKKKQKIIVEPEVKKVEKEEKTSSNLTLNLIIGTVMGFLPYVLTKAFFKNQTVKEINFITIFVLIIFLLVFIAASVYLSIKRKSIFIVIAVLIGIGFSYGALGIGTKDPEKKYKRIESNKPLFNSSENKKVNQKKPQKIIKPEDINEEEVKEILKMTKLDENEENESKIEENESLTDGNTIVDENDKKIIEEKIKDIKDSLDENQNENGKENKKQEKSKFNDKVEEAYINEDGEKLINLLENGEDISYVDENGRNLLHRVLEDYETINNDLLKLMIKSKVDINAKDNNGNSALLNSVKIGNESSSYENIKQLIDSGADVNTFNFEGISPLMKMLVEPVEDKRQLKDKRKIVKLLLKKGADVNLKNSSGISVIDAIEKIEDKKIKKMLLKYKK